MDDIVKMTKDWEVARDAGLKTLEGPMGVRRAHRDKVYATKAEAAASWYK